MWPNDFAERDYSKTKTRITVARSIARSKTELQRLYLEESRQRHKRDAHASAAITVRMGSERNVGPTALHSLRDIDMWLRSGNLV